MDNKKQNVQNKTKRQMTSPIAQLVRIGRHKNYVTYNDILKVIPRPENHLQYLELVLATLQTANIPLVDEKNNRK
jgi:hypothetical protein